MKLDCDLSYDLIRTQRKTLGLTVERDGNITLRAPLDCPQIVIDNFFKDKKMWVYKKLAEKKMVEEQLPPKKYVNGNGFFYLGKSYRLQLVDDGAPLKLSYGFFQLNKKYVANGKRIFIDWYRSHALPIIEGRVNIYKDMLGVNPGAVRVLDLQYRWGSCSSNGSLNIHWKTILAPMPIVDYVVVHELTHVNEKNHTKKFWEMVASILPDYEKRKDWTAELLEDGSLIVRDKIYSIPHIAIIILRKLKGSAHEYEVVIVVLFFQAVIALFAILSFFNV